MSWTMIIGSGLRIVCEKYEGFFEEFWVRGLDDIVVTIEMHSIVTRLCFTELLQSYWLVDMLKVLTITINALMVILFSLNFYFL